MQTNDSPLPYSPTALEMSALIVSPCKDCCKNNFERPAPSSQISVPFGMSRSKEISERNWDRAREYTDISESFSGRQRRVALIAHSLPTYKAMHQLRLRYFTCGYRGPTWSLGANFKLRCAITALDPRESNGTQREPQMIEIQPIEKLNCVPRVKPVRFSFNICEKCSGVKPCLEEEEELVGILTQLEEEQAKRTYSDMLLFTRASIASLEPKISWTALREAESRIDAEIERRINEDRARECVPMVEVLEKLPYEVRFKIWCYALNLQERVWPRVDAEREPIIPYPHPVEHRPILGGLLTANKALALEVVDALYSSRIFAFTDPSSLKSWLESLRLEYLRKIRRIEVFFDPDVALKFVQPGLGFTFRRDTPRLLSNFSIKDLLHLVSPCPKLELIVELPAGHRMSRAFSTAWESDDLYDGYKMNCHATLCKWIVKGAMTACESYNDVCVSVKADYSLHHHPEQVKQVLAVKTSYRDFSWETLGAPSGSDVYRPPKCECLEPCVFYKESNAESPVEPPTAVAGGTEENTSHENLDLEDLASMDLEV